MTPIYQRNSTDCVTAAIASILDMPYESCPQLWSYSGAEWIDKLREFSDSLGLGFVFFNLNNREEWPILDKVYVVISGITPRSDKYDHAVVGLAETSASRVNIRYVHDPYAGGDFISEPSHLFFFVPRIYSLSVKL